MEIGKEVLNKKYSIIEDNLKGFGSESSDFEGNILSPKVWFKNGILENFATDRINAKRLNKKCTGNSFFFSEGFTNLKLEGPLGEENNFSGIYIQDLIGENFNASSGEINSGISGFIMENGEKTYAVTNGVISFNLFDLLKNIYFLDDIPKYGSIFFPSAIVENIQISA